MKQPAVLSFLLLFSAGMAVAPAAHAKAKKAAAPKVDPAQEAMMAKWKAFCTPSDGHHVLDALVGSWDYTVQMWTAPDAAPQTSTGTAQIAWTLDGHWLRQDATGFSMGQFFAGTGTLGFDNLTQQYESIWIDNMATGMMKATGKYDATAKVLTEIGTMPDPMAGQLKPYRGVTTFTDPDHYTYEVFTNTPDGKELKMMSIAYARKK